MSTGRIARLVPLPRQTAAGGPPWEPPPVDGTSADLAVLAQAIIPPGGSLSVRLPDGTLVGRPDAALLVTVRSPDAVRRILLAPGALGLARAYISGELDFDGDIYRLLALRDHLPWVRLDPRVVRAVSRLLRAYGLRPPPPPREEARLRGRRHSRTRDAAAIAHHYDVSNEFYRLVLGPSMTYSCAVWADPRAGLEAAQEAKHELICRKLGLEPGMRMLDVGCGWGSLVAHAARRHGVEAVGVTVSRRQAELARERLAHAGLSERVEIRLQDYRDLADGPYDAIASVGMFEHVGASRLALYFDTLFRLLRPGGRLVNHGISQPGDREHRQLARARLARCALPGSSRTFRDRYVFPDGELHELGHVISRLQAAGFEARHVESLREHYALTLRAWVANLERHWDAAVEAAGTGPARVWRLYLAGSARSFEAGRVQVHQVLAVRPDGGASGMPLRPDWEPPGRPGLRRG